MKALGSLFMGICYSSILAACLAYGYMFDVLGQFDIIFSALLFWLGILVVYNIGLFVYKNWWIYETNE